jgi:hypothetical protein
MFRVFARLSAELNFRKSGCSRSFFVYLSIFNFRLLPPNQYNISTVSNIADFYKDEESSSDEDAFADFDPSGLGAAAGTSRSSLLTLRTLKETKKRKKRMMIERLSETKFQVRLQNTKSTRGPVLSSLDDARKVQKWVAATSFVGVRQVEVCFFFSFRFRYGLFQFRFCAW